MVLPFLSPPAPNTKGSAASGAGRQVFASSSKMPRVTTALALLAMLALARVTPAERRSAGYDPRKKTVNNHLDGDLWRAVKDGDHAAVAAHLKAGAHPHAQSSEGHHAMDLVRMNGRHNTPMMYVYTEVYTYTYIKCCHTYIKCCHTVTTRRAAGGVSPGVDDSGVHRRRAAGAARGSRLAILVDCAALGPPRAVALGTS